MTLEHEEHPMIRETNKNKKRRKYVRACRKLFLLRPCHIYLIYQTRRVSWMLFHSKAGIHIEAMTPYRLDMTPDLSLVKDWN